MLTSILSTPSASCESGSILDIKADIYVNAASVVPLDVKSWGGIASEVCNRLEKESHKTLCQDWEQRGKHIKPGDAQFVSASGEAAPALLRWTKKEEEYKAYLIHAGAPIKRDSKNPADELKKAYQAILKRGLEFQKLTGTKPLTIACPPLGIGIYNNDPVVSAVAAADAFAEFKEKNPTAQIHLKFGIYGGQKDKVFKMAFEKRLQTLMHNVHDVPKPFTPAADKDNDPLPIANQSSITISALVNHLKNEKERYHITKVTANNNTSLTLDMANNTKVTIKEISTPNQPAPLEYSIHKTVSLEKQQETIKDICMLVVESAKPGTIINLTNKNDAINEMTQAALIEAIQYQRSQVPCPYKDINDEPKLYNARNELIEIPSRKFLNKKAII